MLGNMKIRMLWCAAALGGTAFLVGCDKSAAAAKPAGPPPAVPVKMVKAEQRDVPVTIRAIGWVEPYQSVTVKPQIEGQLQDVHFEQGQDVKRGDLLFTIDPRPAQADLDQALAAQARDVALANDADRELNRLSDLLGGSLTTEREVETARADAESKRAQTHVSASAVEAARLRLAYTQIRSPIDGVAGTRMMDRGNIVKANEGGLVIVNQISPVYVRFAVPEQQFGPVRTAMQRSELQVEAKPSGDNGPSEIGKLEFIDNQVDAATGMLRMKAVFKNEDRRLWPGRYADVSLVVAEQPDAVVVPVEAVMESQSGALVYVVRPDQTTEIRKVKTGLSFNGMTVLVSGVEAGETVIRDGQLRVATGAKVSEAIPTTQRAPASQSNTTNSAETAASGPATASTDQPAPPVQPGAAPAVQVDTAAAPTAKDVKP